jgi:hypothetical protein
MSNPVNPLAELVTYAAKHVLIAFDNTEAASAFVVPSTGVGKCGSLVSGVQCGNAIVVVNELEDTSYAIRDLTWSYDFFSTTSQNTTISAGNFTVADTRGNQFPSFLRRVSKRLGVPQTQITFFLMTIFIGSNGEGASPNIRTAPIIFSLLDSATGYRASMVNLFTFNFAMLYNTTAQMPNHSRLDQFTITNKEKNPSRSIPTADGGPAMLIPRRQEDANNNPKRQARMDKSAPMRTLKEIFEAFETDLKELRFTNKRQLQEFMSVVRPSNVKKIKAPKAKRVKAGKDELPITFKVNLEDVYHNYPVDNTNLMTEQTETKQLSTGITSFTVPMGDSVVDAVDALMKLSSRTGDDAINGLAFKTVISSVVGCDGVTTNTINVKQYIIPKNKMGEKDTGPDPKGTVNKLELIFLDGIAGLDVDSLSFSSAPSNDVSVLEEDSDDLKNDPLWVSSQREQTTYERPPEGGFAGLRMSASSQTYGLQSSLKGVSVDRLNHRYALPQNTVTIVGIVGNPDLYSDLARNPAAVAAMTPGSPKLYKFPEYYPMYLTLKVRIGATKSGGVDTGDEEYWYHIYHYHLSGVTNTFVSGKFVQTLRLLSTDDAI